MSTKSKKNESWPPVGEEGQERVLVTPEMALAWTERRYEHQRPVTPAYVRFLIEEIKGERWKYDASTIVFDRQGRLIDGQHRCHAIVGAGVPVEVLVVWGVDESAYKTKDTGRSRVASDVLGVENAKHVATLARSLIFLEKYQDPCCNCEKISNARIVDLVKNDPAIEEAVHAIVGISGVRTVMAPSVAAFGWYFMWKCDPEACRSFWESVGSGAGLLEGDPRLALIRFARNMMGKTTQHKVRRSLLGAMIKAWNAWRTGKRIGLLIYRISEPFPTAI